MTKCSKKIEKLARGLGIRELLNINFPMDKISDRIDESWMVYYEEAVTLNKLINSVQDYELDGEFSDEQLQHWGG